MSDETATLALSALPPGEFARVMMGDTPVCVANIEGDVFAVHDVCTHAAIPLSDGCLEGRQIVCPWHGAMFDLKTGRATCGPAVDAVQTYPVTVEGDTITVAPQ